MSVEEGIPIAVIEARVDARMKGVVFLDGHVYAEHGWEAWEEASGSAELRRTGRGNVREICVMRLSEGLTEAKARWREKAMEDAIYIASWHLLRDRNDARLEGH